MNKNRPIFLFLFLFSYSYFLLATQSDDVSLTLVLYKTELQTFATCTHREVSDVACFHPLCRVPCYYLLPPEERGDSKFTSLFQT